MESIHVILCGTDAFRLESALQGTVEKGHAAWNKTYRVSCTNALSIDKVDKRLLLICHVIVLCKGCRAPETRDSYNGRPVISMNDAQESCVEAIRDTDFYYGSTTIEELREKVVSVGLTPTQVVYDTLLQCLTPVGEAALRRAFWLLDKVSNDGALDKKELLVWRRQTNGANYSEKDLSALLSESSIPGLCNSGDGDVCSMNEEQFRQLHTMWLAKGKVDDAWATLHVVGTHPTGLPYSWYDLNSVRIDRDVNTYLSAYAIPFFKNVHKRLRSGHADDSVDNLWALTPGCPWENIAGLATKNIPLDKFIEYWKYMALERRDLVIQYARHWGYKGESGSLFVRRNARVCREREESLPNMIQVLVVGSARCGRKALMHALTAEEGEAYSSPKEWEDLYVRTTTFYVTKGATGQSEEPQSIAYTTVPPDAVDIILTNDNLNKTFDAVLLCFDGSDGGSSAQYLLNLCTRTMVHNAAGSTKMPYVVVATKMDVAPKGSKAIEKLESYCRSQQLLWPPVTTSAKRPEESEIAVLNEYMYSVAMDPDMAVGNPPLTWVRVLRRATFTAIVAVGTLGLLQTAVSALLRRRRR